jgi:hypothetical protein
MNTARANAGITTAADDKEIVDFAERLRYVLELKINRLNSHAQINIPGATGRLMIRIQV